MYFYERGESSGDGRKGSPPRCIPGYSTIEPETTPLERPVSAINSSREVEVVVVATYNASQSMSVCQQGANEQEKLKPPD